MTNKERLIEAAITGRKNSYSPYSNFKVGASLLMKNDVIITGANIENSSYGLCNCAERSALFAAYSQGFRKDDIVGMAIVADTDGPCSPCGACRQVISELLNPNTPVYLANLKGDTMDTNPVELLPFAFSGEDLEWKVDL